MKTMQVPANCKIALPKRLFRPADRVAMVTMGDTLLIKRIEPPRLSSVAERVTERPMSLRQIDREVQAYRRAKRAR